MCAYSLSSLLHWTKLFMFAVRESVESNVVFAGPHASYPMIVRISVNPGVLGRALQARGRRFDPGWLHLVPGARPCLPGP